MSYEKALANDAMKREMATGAGYKIFYVWDDIDEEVELDKALMFIIDNMIEF